MRIKRRRCFVLASITALSFSFTLLAQPEFASLQQAYTALGQKDYDKAIERFQQAIALAPDRVDIRKDLAYTFLKIGEPELARDQFHRSMELDPADQTVALEFAFLSYEARTDPVPAKALARRILNSLRHTGNATAATAFENIDRPLREGIERWTKALEIGPESTSVHYELAQLAEQRDEFALASRHYLRAWQMLPQRRSILLDSARVENAQGHAENNMAALLAASRGGEPRTSEKARELLPARYPYVYEFRAALALDPGNIGLHRELGFLLLAMHDPSAEEEFREIVTQAPDDLLSSAQLGFLYLADRQRAAAMPLLERVLSADKTDLSSRVRSAIEPFLMAKRSLEAGFLKDALRYLTIAHESDPDDYDVMLKLGWTNNMLHNDLDAEHWFDLARKSPNLAISGEASKAYENLKESVERFRTTAWVLPFYSSRWNDVFAYGQIKSELNRPRFVVRPYLSTRLIADTKPVANSQPLSERSFIIGAGLVAQWRHFTGWAEAGSAIGYVSGSMVPDYRGGLAWSGVWKAASGFFVETNADEVFISRFDNDWLSYLQTRLGFRWFLMNANLTADTNRQHWANFVEAGPGIRFHIPNSPKNLQITLNFLRGLYLVGDGNPQHTMFSDFRAGFWYALTK